jgi:hypothetical protein
MCTVCGARMPAGGATSTPQPPLEPPRIDARFPATRLLVVQSGAIAFSAALPDARPHRRIGPATSLADH